MELIFGYKLTFECILLVLVGSVYGLLDLVQPQHSRLISGSL